LNVIYLVPCSCGCKIPVDKRQAGEIITCSCGASLEVPTLLKLMTLERAEVAHQPLTPKTTWSTGHRLILLGTVVIIVAVVIGVWLFWVRPTDPYANLNPEQIQSASQLLSPMQSWRLWVMLEKGGLKHRKQFIEVTFADVQAQHRIFWGLLAVVAGVGMALVVIGNVVIYYRDKISVPARR